MDYRFRPAVAAQRLMTGCFVRLDGDRAFSDFSLGGKGGIVRPAPGSVRTEWIDEGAPIEIMTDGGAKARLLRDVEIRVRGTLVRLCAAETPFLHVVDGRVVGFEGDRRVAR